MKINQFLLLLVTVFFASLVSPAQAGSPHDPLYHHVCEIRTAADRLESSNRKGFEDSAKHCRPSHDEVSFRQGVVEFERASELFHRSYAQGSFTSLKTCTCDLRRRYDDLCRRANRLKLGSTTKRYLRAIGDTIKCLERDLSRNSQYGQAAVGVSIPSREHASHTVSAHVPARMAVGLPASAIREVPRAAYPQIAHHDPRLSGIRGGSYAHSAHAAHPHRSAVAPTHVSTNRVAIPVPVTPVPRYLPAPPPRW